MLAMAKTLKMMSEPFHITTDLTFCRKYQTHGNVAANTAQSDKLRSDVSYLGGLLATLGVSTRSKGSPLPLALASSRANHYAALLDA